MSNNFSIFVAKLYFFYERKQNHLTLLYYILGVNLLSYFLMWKDKMAAKRSTSRVSENNLLTLALMGGSAGIYLGTLRPVYHKRSKWVFNSGIPVVLIIQLILLIYFLLQNRI